MADCAAFATPVVGWILQQAETTIIFGIFFIPICDDDNDDDVMVVVVDRVKSNNRFYVLEICFWIVTATL